MENIEQLRDRNLRELTNLESKKKQLAEELKATLAQLGLEQMPSQEYIEEQIKAIKDTVSEKEANLEKLLKQYSDIVAAENGTPAPAAQPLEL